MNPGRSLRSIGFILGLAVAHVAFSAAPAQALVKQSNSGICHDGGSAWFEKTRNYKSFGSMSECVTSGRPYKGYSGSERAAPRTASTAAPTPASVSVPYDRDLYDHWIDEDHDCQNARHELLQELSTGRVTLSSSGCTVKSGRWNDPYTGNIYTNSTEIDIDHKVPLAWAHAHGADKWNKATRRKFANDKVNLFAVQASANRQKGAKGPLEWLPPSQAFQCSYVTRFHRIVLTYKLQYTAYERKQMDEQRAYLCD
jgi:hypothetical protein